LLAGLAAAATGALARFVRRADRTLDRLISALAAGEMDTAPAPRARDGGLSGAREALARIDARRRANWAGEQRRLDHLQTLVDTVSAALLVVERDGSVVLANRAAQKLSSQIDLDDALAGLLGGLRPGTREVIRLAPNRRMLAATARLTTPTDVRTLLSLQDIESELDATEVKAWRDLARILAHEMMNSLTPIVSLAESLRPLLADPATANMIDVVAAIDVIGVRSAGLMSFVERYRRVADLPQPILRPIRLAEVIAKIDRLLGPTMVRSGVAYASRVTPEDLTILADPEMIEQALINMARNAIDAVAAHPAPAIEVSGRLEDEQVVIDISDNGHGVDPALLDGIFVPFFTTKSGGSGIGLSLARQIAIAHSGQIEAMANSPRGMVFRWRMPIQGPVETRSEVGGAA